MNNSKIKLKSRKGITLISLVVTIIILLILVGITIAQLSGNGLFTRVKEAKQKTLDAQDNENEKLDEYANAINEIVGTRAIEDETLKIQNTMSGTEHFTGDYYIDGKPIYAKTIYISSLPNKTIKYYNHGAQNVDEIWFDTSKSFAKFPVGFTIPLPHVHIDGVGSQLMICDLDTTKFAVKTGIDRSTLKAYITINYTKTTDEGNNTTIPATPAN